MGDPADDLRDPVRAAGDLAQDAAMSGTITVVGIGADGMAGLSRASRDELASATVVYGAPRQLELLDDSVTRDRREWPSPMLPALPTLFDEAGAESDVHVVASGDPLLHGIGATLIRLFGVQRVRVLPHVSSVTLACARMGWTVPDTEVISLVTAAPHTAVRRGGRAIVLSRDGQTPATLARLLSESGRGDSQLTVLQQLGGPGERRYDGTAAQWATTGPTDVDDLNVVAVAYLPDERRAQALPDEAFAHDGQLTKQSIRAVTLAALGPRPGELLWDIGSGSGSIAIEWSRSAPGCAAVAFERDEQRRDRIVGNVTAFGVRVEVRGAAPEALDGAPEPAAIFIGGGVTQPGLLQACYDRLPSGGRLVANAVTVESEAFVAQWYSKEGGELRRYQHYQGGAVGGFTGWRPALPVTQWSVVKR
ncbi:precorrin-6Y C5,15-methyltransferase (decarboxylating) [Mycobacterium frederiksbergense]|uniref:Precorrin-6Y C5,15-methyltransferase (Decarboxylating) n=2 Tax=Mycolicibacterium frederiksbergense TaxID=117567 RepID=A0ABT6KYR1_9MYCO|nr:precorrin-6Y C5,15-methyltransferase (decarboxylating) [Mycolicibacterium frederiksbergense]